MSPPRQGHHNEIISLGFIPVKSFARLCRCFVCEYALPCSCGISPHVLVLLLKKKGDAVFRFGVIADLIGGRKLLGEKRRDS